MQTLQPDAIRAARQHIGEHVRVTPQEHSASLSQRLGVPVWLKLESQQATGSFKLRGAVNAVAQLSAEARRGGVVTASTGNHGRALAHAAAQQGVRATVCLSRLVPANKVEAIRALGAQVRICGDSQDAAEAMALRLAAEEGATYLPPFDHPHIIAGQGTLGLEILEQCPEVAEVLVPLSGGGLLAGVALAIKSARDQIRVHGISMRRGAAMHASLQAGHPVEVEEQPTLADSLGGGIGLHNRFTFGMTRSLCDALHLLDEPAIAAGIRHAYREERLVIEGAAAVGISALLEGLIEPRGPVVVVISGRNIDIQQHLRVINGENS
ncbi:hydroxyectoine utilization dehydratase EutB [Stutzerimonas nosocomialis]|uniref:Hydroxyectoine utilization dehydratase EutB n=1 Tax=Stutzerimonas nosocomialis TaxID=1056496 RepID=A0A5R9QCG7_9GAMM|nr:hydroxyectoine utilization dehydratase EutB [Stutzerimonas nosocomialis]TLX62375.1 hydroxyectoine utilization dehydratase EutB [Stutzerimonas nosocomialis]